MVAKIVSGKKVAGIVHYNEDKVDQRHAQLLMASGFAADIRSLTLNMKINRFRQLTRLNAATKTNAIHISLNFHHKDRLDSTRLSAIARQYMEGIGFGNQPYLVYQHLDVHHPHLHIVSTNIRRDGSRIDVHGIGYRLSEPVRKQIEREHSLTVAEGRSEKQEIEKIMAPRQLDYGQKATKKSLSKLIRAVREHYVYGSLPEFNAILKTFNAVAVPGTAGSRMEQNRGLLYSVLDENGKPVGVPIKASALSGQPILRNLEKDFVQKQELKPGLKPGLKVKIELALNSKVSSLEGFKKVLSRYNIDLVVARSKEGRVFGLSYIDHESKIIIKGSELGKSYAAFGLVARFGRAQKIPVRENDDQRAISLQHAEQFVTGKGQGLMPDLNFLLEPGEGLAIPTVNKRKKKKKRSQERGQQR
ncbi:hypothetical protein SRABI27_03792 [Pedobacter sp. Bi27]|uniref:relaxase/mobilization nuclease domain-containing protein n=1 Tax=Pedobacter sp. Bi27 TaxID=2822351 RepID=UPI001DD226A5|nr:relaxase/mobilization nuclease domain-containing protein [Pedobacter sp. Bi27]CAH0281673.1 hypothetical protein SRABI27_03792 [Pedobacter sp. Bi27]